MAVLTKTKRKHFTEWVFKGCTWWLRPVISNTWDVDIRRIMF
jgi:hypothetical protein